MSRTRSLLREYGFLLILIALTLVAALPTLTYPLGRDQGEFATIGRGLLQGSVLYTELWNPKPPAVFYVYAGAMAVFGQTAPALRLIDLFIVPFIMLALYDIGRSLAHLTRQEEAAGRWIGVASAVVFALFYFTETFWTLTQNDGIALLPMIASAAALLRAARGQGWGWTLAAGILSGWAVWFKYPFALFSIAMLLLYALTASSLRSRASLYAIAAFLFGNLLFLGMSVGVLLAQGAFAAWLESIRVTSSYTALGLNWVDFGESMRVALGYRWSQWGLLFALAGIGVVVSLILPHPRPLSHSGKAPERERGERFIAVGISTSDHTSQLPLPSPQAAFACGRGAGGEGRIVLPLLLWLLSGLAIMLVQAKGYDYHWLPMLLPLCLLAGYGVWRVTQSLQPRLPLLRYALPVAALALLAWLVWSPAFPYITGQVDELTYQRRFQGGEYVASESQKMVNWLTARNVPGDSLYIWGFRPEVYYLSNLNPPTRFIFQFPLVGSWYPPEWREENVEVLWAALPPYVLVLEGDYMRWVTGIDEDSATLLQAYTQLNDWLIYNYERDEQVGPFLVWRRKPR